MTNEDFINSIKLDGEVWKTCANWERYMISSFGRIASKFAPYVHQDKIYNKRASLLCPNDNGHGYMTIILSDGNGHQKRCSIHRLVASTFIPNPNNYPTINHKDENTKNNRADNLEWCTQAYNNAYGTCRKRASAALRQTHPFLRPLVQLSIDGEFIARFKGSRFASEQTGIPKTTITNACRKGNVVRNKYIFRYLDDYEPLSL